MSRQFPVFVGIGSNLGDAQAQVVTAMQALEALADGEFTRSALYCSAPVGPQDQDSFINSVVGFATLLGPFRLLERLLTIEQEFGRERVRHWGPRTLDLDLLMYDDLIIQSTRLQVPHPEMLRRAFVLRPLQDVAPDLKPLGRGLSHWLQNCADQEITQL